MKYLFTLLVVAVISVFSVQNLFFDDSSNSNSLNLYSELEKDLEVLCSNFIDDGGVVEISINLINANLTLPRSETDKAVSLELLVDSQSKFLFFDSIIIDDENEKSRLERNLRLWILAEEYVAGARVERINEILSEVEGMEKDKQVYFKQVSREMMYERDNEVF